MRVFFAFSFSISIFAPKYCFTKIYKIMDKKKYVKPSMKVVKLEKSVTLLQASNGGSKNTPGAQRW